MAGNRILISFTTAINPEEKLKDLKRFKIKEIALFVSRLDKKQRKRVYKRLWDAGIRSIPHVHARSDMESGEYELLQKRFKTKVFNIHPLSNFPLQYDYGKRLDKKIFIENVIQTPTDDEMARFGGLCLDFAHLENDRRLDRKKYLKVMRLARKHKIGCCHMSAILKKKFFYPKCGYRHDFHYYFSLENFDYLKRYKKFFPHFMSLEVENSIEDQLRAREYIKKFI